MTHPGFYFAVKKTYLIPTLFRRAAGCDCAGSGLGDYSYEFSRYEQAPGDVQKREIEARAAAKDGE